MKTGDYRFYVRDHLGSVRVVLDDDGNVLQQLYYHPFGGVWGDAGTNTSLQPWKYSGKEYDHRDGLDLYDYGARLYDPAAVRWTSPDPLCEKYYHISPYAFCNNNPVRYVDPDGRKWKEIKDENVAKKLRRSAENRIAKLNAKKEAVNEKTESIRNNIKLATTRKDKKIQTQNKKMSDIQEQINILSDFIEGLKQLGNSENVYTYKIINSGEGNKGTLTLEDDGSVGIVSFGTYGSRAHETVHAVQLDNGVVKFNNGKPLAGRLREAEVQAYRTEYSIMGGVVPHYGAGRPMSIYDITTDWVGKLMNTYTNTTVY